MLDNGRILTPPGFFLAVILSDEVAVATEESKDPYTAHPLSPGVIFDGVSWKTLGTPFRDGTASHPARRAAQE